MIHKNDIKNYLQKSFTKTIYKKEFTEYGLQTNDF